MQSKEYELDSIGDLANIIKKSLEEELKIEIKEVVLTFSARNQTLTAYWEEKK